MDNLEVVHQVEFMLDEEKKVTIKSSEESFPLYVLGMVNNNPDYKEGKSLIVLLSDSLGLFVAGEKLRPVLSKPIKVNVRVHGREKGIEDHTLFGFFQYPQSTTISIALFDDELEKFPEEAKEAIQYNLIEGLDLSDDAD